MPVYVAAGANKEIDMENEESISGWTAEQLNEFKEKAEGRGCAKTAIHT